MNVRLPSPAPRRVLLLIVLVYAIAFRLITLNRPFYYDDEATGSFYGVIARNYLQFPWKQTHGIPVVTVGHPPGVAVSFYPDHPPLVPLLIVPVYKMFGIGEWQTRLPSSIASVLTVAVLYLLMRHVGSERAALVASALFAATPMVLYFGGQPEVLGMPLVLFALATVFAYVIFHRETTWPSFAVLIGAFTLAAVSDWPAFVLIPVLVAHFGATQPRRQWRWMVALCGYAGVVFLLQYVYVAVAAELPWNWMVPLFMHRSALGGDTPFTARDWLRIAWSYNLHRHSLPLIAATLAWVVLEVARPGRRPGAVAGRLLLAWAALHVVIGRQGVYNHEWWWWPLTPGIAIASALLADRALAIFERRGRSWIALPLLAVGVGAFAVYTTVKTYKELYPPRQQDPFTTVDLGRAIQAAAPAPNDVAMLVWSGEDPELWFYGDRALRANIWSIDDFRARVAGGDADLVFSDTQPWPTPSAGLVFPLIELSTSPALYAYLAKRYPLVPLPRDLAEKFQVFDLRLSAPHPNLQRRTARGTISCSARIRHQRVSRTT